MNDDMSCSRWTTTRGWCWPRSRVCRKRCRWITSLPPAGACAQAPQQGEMGILQIFSREFNTIVFDINEGFRFLGSGDCCKSIQISSSHGELPGNGLGISPGGSPCIEQLTYWPLPLLFGVDGACFCFYMVARNLICWASFGLPQEEIKQTCTSHCESFTWVPHNYIISRKLNQLPLAIHYI